MKLVGFSPLYNIKVQQHACNNIHTTNSNKMKTTWKETTHIDHTRYLNRSSRSLRVCLSKRKRKVCPGQAQLVQKRRSYEDGNEDRRWGEKIKWGGILLCCCLGIIKAVGHHV